MRERGLKPAGVAGRAGVDVSLPTRERGLKLGLRNSHDKTYPSQRVLICVSSARASAACPRCESSSLQIRSRTGTLRCEA